jgi:hypothetical protein
MRLPIENAPTIDTIVNGRQLIILSRVSPVESPLNPHKQGRGFSKYRQNESFCRETQLPWTQNPWKPVGEPVYYVREARARWDEEHIEQVATLQERYAARRLLLAQRGFIYSDMDIF